MKKRLLSIVLAAVLICGAVPLNAFAANEGSGTMAVSYTYSSEYTINIPATISINDSETAEITATGVNIGTGKTLAVFIDTNTYENGGNFYLYKDKGTENERRMACSVLRGTANGSTWESITGLGERVASFADGNTQSFAYGRLKFKPEVEPGLPYGTYTGTIRFMITITDM